VAAGARYQNTSNGFFSGLCGLLATSTEMKRYRLTIQMKKLLTSTVALGALVAPAMAAGPYLYLPPNRVEAGIAAPAAARPPPASVWSWTGLYIGANAGWIGSSSNTITNTGTDTGTGGLGTFLGAGKIPGSIGISHSGFIGGGQIGYNWQWTPNWVVGLEADFDGLADPSSTVIVAFPGSAAFVPFQTGYSRALDTLGTVRGRVGYLSSPNLLWYATGGLAYGDPKLQTAFACATCASPASTSILTSGTQTGWTVGAGVEWRFASSWSVKLEYLYVDLGSRSNTVTYTNGPTSSMTSTFSERDNIVRAGLNYKFW
jgi:outer membrane immunogenic protein